MKILLQNTTFVKSTKSVKFDIGQRPPIEQTKKEFLKMAVELDKKTDKINLNPVLMVSKPDKANKLIIL